MTEQFDELNKGTRNETGAVATEQARVSDATTGVSTDRNFATTDSSSTADSPSDVGAETSKGITFEADGIIPKAEAELNPLLVGEVADAKLTVAYHSKGYILVEISGRGGDLSFQVPADLFSVGNQFTFHFSAHAEKGTVFTFHNLTTDKIHAEVVEKSTDLLSFDSLKGVSYETGGIRDVSVRNGFEDYKPDEVTPDGIVDGTDDDNKITEDFIDKDGDRVTDKDDEIHAGAGSDFVNAGAGNDGIIAGDGRDVVEGDAGDDIIEGDGGDDLLYGGTGNDQIIGGAGSDYLSGGAGDDTIFTNHINTDGSEESDIAEGGAGNDTFVAGKGDFVDGGAGKYNVLYASDAQNALIQYNPNGTSGIIQYLNGQTLTFTNIQSVQGVGPTNPGGLYNPNNPPDGTVQGTNLDDVIDHDYTGDPHDDMVDADDAILPGDTHDMDVIEAYGGNDTITAGDDADEVYAGSGNDWVQGNEGEDLIFGEDGNDVIFGDDAIVQPGGAPMLSDQAGPAVGGDYCVVEGQAISLNFETKKDILTEDVWFAEHTVIVTDYEGQIIGDCDIIEGNNGQLQVKLDSVVTQDTQIVLKILGGTATQAAPTYNEFTSLVYFQGAGANQTSTNDTQWWVADQAHMDFLNNGANFGSSNFWTQNGWGPGTVSNTLFSQPTAQNPNPGTTGSPSDIYIGTGALVNDYRLLDDQGNEITGNTITLNVPAGSDTSNAVTVVANLESMVRGMPQQQFYNIFEGDEHFNIEIDSIGGAAVSGNTTKQINIDDAKVNVYSPISFDLNNNGEIDTTGSSTAYMHDYTGGQTVLFDIDGNSLTGNANGEEQIEWLEGTGDGLLIDTTGLTIGQQVTGDHLFGDEGGTYTDGYQKLALTRDANSDGVVDGAELNNLGIWVDDGDAVLEAGELETLAENGITELTTVYTPVLDANGDTMYRSVTESDAELAGTVTYSLTGPDAQYFVIDPDTGVVTYAPGFSPDFDNPQDQGGDNTYDFNVVRTCTDPVGVSSEAVSITIKDPCIGDDDMIYGGKNDDLIDGQGGDDILFGDLGDDGIFGGCGEDVINGDNGLADEDLDPSDGFVSVIDDNPCFCIDLSTTKSMVTEDVWFAEKVTIVDPGTGLIVGECDLTEGEDGTYSIELDAPATQSMFITITLTDLTANFAVQADFPEYFHANGYGGPLNQGEETQYFAVSQGHLTAMTNSWGNLSVFFQNPDTDSSATGNSQTDTIVGVANLTNDYELLDDNGDYVTVPTITLFIPQGGTTSESFTVETNVETLLSPNFANSNGGVQHEGVEQFRIEITEINGNAVTGEYKDVNIHNLDSETYSPIAFDLNCNGVIDVTGNSTAYGHAFDPGAVTVSFDIDGDGSEEEIEWMVANQDGLLIDTDVLAANGNYANGKALFGDEGGIAAGGYANGYEKLALRDLNGDNVLTGAELNGLSIWVDDGDGDYEVGELQSLISNGITELSTVGINTVVNGETLIRSNTEIDAELTGMVTYAIDPSSPDAAYFQIDPQTGKITYADGFHPDFDNPADADGDNIYNLIIVRSGGTFDQPQYEELKIQVTDDGFGGDDKLFGGADNDVIDGQSGDDYIEGNGGDDRIDGGFGDDVIYGDTPGTSSTGGYVYGENPGQCQEVILAYDKVLAGSETASVPNTAQVGDSVVYTDVTTFQGISVSAKVTLVELSDPNLEVDLANASGAEILINASGNPAMQDEFANFSVEFFDPATGASIEIDPVIGFADLDGGSIPERDLIYIHDQVADAGITSTTTVEYGFDQASSSLKAGGLAPNSSPYDPDATIAVKFDQTSGFKFELYTGEKPTDLTFGPVSQGDYVFEIAGGTSGTDGDDVIVGGWGDDLIYGQGGNDEINSTGEDCDHDGLRDIGYPGLYPSDFDPNNDLDIVYGGAGNDAIFTGDDVDYIYAGSGNDKMDGGIDADIIYAEDGNDFVVGGEGSDRIYAGTGNDVIYGDEIGGGIHTIPDDTDLVPFNDEDLIYGGTGDDLMYGGDDKDTMFGGFGNDRIYGGIDNDCLYGGENDDLIIGGDGDDIVYGGLGDDKISGDDGDDLLYGGAGHDQIRGGDGNDEIYGGTGNDQIGPGAGEDLVYGGIGDDTIFVGSDDTAPDDLYGGGDRDIFVISGPTDGDCYDGGTGSTAPGDVDDYDILDLSNVENFQIVDQFVDETGVGASTSGKIVFYNDAGDIIGESKFKEIEQIIYCFTPGTMIATPRGEIAVENLAMGDKVLTRDNGMQEITWYGSKSVTKQDMVADPSLKPVMITSGALGGGLPEKDLMVSPNHRVLVSNVNTELYFGESEVLVAAKHLVGKPGIHTVDVTDTNYIHFMCERHEVVLSNGTWTESFQPGEQALKGLHDDQRGELFKLFPELETEAGRGEFTAARTILKSFEAKLAI